MNYENGDAHFELNDGNHRLEAYKRLGINEYYVIVHSADTLPPRGRGISGAGAGGVMSFGREK